MDLAKLQTTLEELGQPAYRFKQIKLAMYRDLKEGFDAIENIPLALRQDLNRLLPFNELILKTEQKSLDGSGKNLFFTRDDLAIELSLIHISEPTRLGMISYAVFCLKKK